MNLVADESVDRHIVERLRFEGHETTYIAELNPGISDEEVLQSANRRNAILITADKDFGELVFRQGRLHTGVLLLRLSGLPASAKAELACNTIRDHSMDLHGAFSVISPGMVRIRHTP